MPNRNTVYHGTVNLPNDAERIALIANSNTVCLALGASSITYFRSTDATLGQRPNTGSTNIPSPTGGIAATANDSTGNTVTYLTPPAEMSNMPIPMKNSVKPSTSLSGSQIVKTVELGNQTAF